MRRFDFYEFVGVISPGVIIILGLQHFYPTFNLIIKEHTLSVGDLTLFLIVSYITGHLVQAVGNFFEIAWWFLWGGMPTDWIRSGKHFLISQIQVEALFKRFKALKLRGFQETKQFDRGEWFTITRQIYATVKSEGLSERVDLFNGNYGFFRGLAAGFLILVVVSLTEFNTYKWSGVIIVTLLLGLSLYRMHRFGRLYARELFIQFLNAK